MNSAQLHLLFTHTPIIGLGFAILLNLVAIIRKSGELQKLSLWCYLVLGVFGLIAYLTGDDAGKIMETYPGITKDIIETHENIALLFFIGLMVTSALSLVGLYITKTKVKFLARFNLYLFIAAILLSILAVKTGSTGGAIRHTEITQGAYKQVK